MDVYLNLKAFHATAECGNFSRAARELGVAASVVTKRVNQLEQQLGEQLFTRSTRALVLTEPGRRYLNHTRGLVSQIDELLARSREPRDIEDFLRVKAPTTLTLHYLNGVFQRFARDFPKVRLELVLIDGPIDPVSEGFDIAVGAFPMSFGGVTDEPLCRLRRLLCASPDYLAARGVPTHPRELVEHDCLSFLPTGNSWVFESDRGPVSIEVAPKLSSNDGRVLVDAAIQGNGIALASRYACAGALRDKRLVPVLADFPLPDMWIKAIAPERRAGSTAVRMLIDRLKAALTPVPPWEREGSDAAPGGDFRRSPPAASASGRKRTASGRSRS